MNRDVYLQAVRQHLQTAYLLNEEKTEGMIPVFVATLREHVERLAALADTGDLDELGRAGHAVKGALLNMGLPDLAELARQLEQQGRERSGPVDRTLISELQRAVDLLAGT